MCIVKRCAINGNLSETTNFNSLNAEYNSVLHSDVKFCLASRLRNINIIWKHNLFYKTEFLVDSISQIRRFDQDVKHLYILFFNGT